MGKPWRSREFGPLLKGLVDRWQELPDDALFARRATNIDFFGGVVGKRGGTQLLTGWGSYTLTATAAGEVLRMQSVGPGALGGYQVGDVVTIYESDDLDVLPTTNTVAALDQPSNQLTLGSPVAVAGGAHIIVTRPIPGTPAVRGLFPAIFRNAHQHLVAAAGGAWWRVRSSGTPTLIPEQYGTFVIDSWTNSTTFNLAGSGGSPTTFEGMNVGDEVIIPGAGPGGADLRAKIIAFGQAFFLGRMVIDTPATTQPTGVTATIRLLTPDPTVGQFGVMFSNVLHLSMQALGDVFYPPRKYMQVVGDPDTGVIYRHGIVAPASLAAISGIAGSISVACRVIYAYRNSRTGQESLPSGFTDILAVSTGFEVSVPASLDPQVDQIRVYFTADGDTGSDYYLVTTVANVGAPGYVTIPFTTSIILGTRLARLDRDTQAPKQTEQFVPWVQTNRLLAIVQRTATQPGYLIFSEPPDLEEGWLKGESFPSTNALFVNHDDGDRYVAGAAFHDSIVIFKRRSTWRIVGVPPSTQVFPVHYTGTQTGIGAIAAKMVVQDHDELLFAHDDGFYELRLLDSGLSGFQSKRMSLPVDRTLLNTTPGDREKGHAIFFRPTRQIRAWVDEARCLVFTFDGPLTGEPMGWAKWVLLLRRGNVPMNVTASASAPAAEGVTTGWDVSGAGYIPPGVAYLGTNAGLILQMDMGTADLGGVAFETEYESVDFPPAGRGTGARGRALDLQVAAFERAMTGLTSLGLRLTTDQLVAPIDLTLDVVGRFMPFIPFHMLVNDPIPVEFLGALFIAPGQYHRIRFSEQAVDTMWRIMAWNYWYQDLPITEITRRFLQGTLERLT